LKHALSNRLRIIGGQWRSRVIEFPDAPGLRPTPNRVRETLFNWLREAVIGARCLDLFAGSGALGLEALSRGARRVIQVERQGEACAALRRNALTLGADALEVVENDVFRFLEGPVTPSDLAFLDPPFGEEWIAPCCRLLETRGWLSEGAHIYVEVKAGAPPGGLPDGWRLLKSGKAGEVGYHLYQRQPERRNDTHHGNPPCQ
jgi:16S rRNA (guanine966-N2)-methyltransferase